VSRLDAELLYEGIGKLRYYLAACEAALDASDVRQASRYLTKADLQSQSCDVIARKILREEGHAPDR